MAPLFSTSVSQGEQHGNTCPSTPAGGDGARDACAFLILHPVEEAARQSPSLR